MSPSKELEWLGSWKEIAAYLHRDIRTVQRWEKKEGLPVHRHLHEQQGSVYAFPGEIDHWLEKRRNPANTAAGAVAEEPSPVGPGTAGTAAAATAPRKQLSWILAAALAAFVAAGVLWWVSEKASAKQDSPRVLPLTSYPGDERDPSFSPTGDFIAFSWNGPKQDNYDIFVKSVDPSAEPVRLTSESTADLSPAWSPDGRSIAYLRAPRDVMVISALGGQARRILRTEQPMPFLDPQRVYPTYLAWSSDSRWLVFPRRKNPDEAWRLWAVSIETGEQRELTSGQDHQMDVSPSLSPDGRHLLFFRYLKKKKVELRLLPLTPDFRPAGEPILLHQAQGLPMSRPSWIGNGEVLFTAGGFRQMRSLSVLAISRSGDVRRNPTKFAAAGEDAASSSIAPKSDVRRLVYQRRIYEQNIWRLDLTQVKSRSAAPFISSTMDDYNARFSPEGSKIAFVSFTVRQT